MVVRPYWKIGWLPSVVFGIPFDDPEERTTAVITAPATTTAPTPVQNHHVLYAGGDSLAGAAA
jgi:hypothetical protein